MDHICRNIDEIDKWTFRRKQRTYNYNTAWAFQRARTWWGQRQCRTAPTARTPSWLAHCVAWSTSPACWSDSRSSWSPASPFPWPLAAAVAAAYMRSDCSDQHLLYLSCALLILNVVLATSWKWLILCTYHKRGRRPQDPATSHRKTCKKIMALSRAMIWSWGMQ